MKTKYLCIIVTTLLTLAACSPVGTFTTPAPTSAPSNGLNDAPPATSTPLPQSDATRQPAPVPPTVAPSGDGEAPRELVQQAVADLVERLNAAETDIEVVMAIAVTWNDGSLGCAQPGVEYIQTPIDGYQIQLQYQGALYDYHANQTTVFLCENTLVRGPRATPVLAPEIRLVNAAILDLAQRLGISAHDIAPQPIAPKVWPDASLGCPQPGQAYAEVETQGYEITLKVGATAYTYHSDLQHVVYCETP